MYIKSVPNRNSPPAILLRESYREGGKSGSAPFSTSSDWPRELDRRLRRRCSRAARSSRARRRRSASFAPCRTGTSAAALGTARRIGLDRLIGPDGNRRRDLILALVVSRILDPSSKLAAARALSPETAASSLGDELVSGSSTRRSSTRRSTGSPSRQPAIEASSPSGISLAGRSCSTTSPRATWRAAAARSPVRLQPRRQAGQAPDRLRPALRPRRLPGRHRGLRRLDRRPGDARRTGRQAQAALRPRPRCPRR